MNQQTVDGVLRVLPDVTALINHFSTHKPRSAGSLSSYFRSTEPLMLQFIELLMRDWHSFRTLAGKRYDELPSLRAAWLIEHHTELLRDGLNLLAVRRAPNWQPPSSQAAGALAATLVGRKPRPRSNMASSALDVACPPEDCTTVIDIVVLLDASLRLPAPAAGAWRTAAQMWRDDEIGLGWRVLFRIVSLEEEIAQYERRRDVDGVLFVCPAQLKRSATTARRLFLCLARLAPAAEQELRAAVTAAVRAQTVYAAERKDVDEPLPLPASPAQLAVSAQVNQAVAGIMAWLLDAMRAVGQHLAAQADRAAGTAPPRGEAQGKAEAAEDAAQQAESAARKAEETETWLRDELARRLCLLPAALRLPFVRLTSSVCFMPMSRGSLRRVDGCECDDWQSTHLPCEAELVRRTRTRTAGQRYGAGTTRRRLSSMLNDYLLHGGRCAAGMHDGEPTSQQLVDPVAHGHKRVVYTFVERNTNACEDVDEPDRSEPEQCTALCMALLCMWRLPGCPRAAAAPTSATSSS